MEFLRLFVTINAKEKGTRLEFIHAELLGWIMRCITWHMMSSHLPRVSGKFTGMYTGWSSLDVDVRQCASDSLGRDVEEKTQSTINYWNIFQYRRPILPAASAGGLSIAFFWQKLWISGLLSVRYTQRRSRRTCTRSVTICENLKVPFFNFKFYTKFLYRLMERRFTRAIHILYYINFVWILTLCCHILHVFHFI